MSVFKFPFSSSFFWQVVIFSLVVKMLSLLWRDWISVVFSKNNCKIASDTVKEKGSKCRLFCLLVREKICLLFKFLAICKLAWLDVGMSERQEPRGAVSSPAWTAAWVVAFPRRGWWRGERERVVEDDGETPNGTLESLSSAVELQHFHSDFTPSTLKTKLIVDFMCWIYFFLLFSYLCPSSWWKIKLAKIK